jgi:FAT domain
MVLLCRAVFAAVCLCSLMQHALTSIVHRSITDEQDLDTWLKMASLSRKHGNFTLCAATLRSLGAQPPPPQLLFTTASTSATAAATASVGGSSSATAATAGTATATAAATAAAAAAGYQAVVQPPLPSSAVHPRVLYAVYKYMWAAGDRHAALSHLHVFVRKLEGELACNGSTGNRRSAHNRHHCSGSSSSRLLVSALVRGARWQLALMDEAAQKPEVDAGARDAEVYTYIQCICK